MQKWYLLKLVGDESEVNLDSSGHAEFDAWKWGDESTAIRSVIRFKRDVYKSIFKEFRTVLDKSSND